MLVRCNACRGAKQVNGLGSMGMVNCKACKGTGKIKEEFDIDLTCTQGVGLPENFGLGSEHDDKKKLEEPIGMSKEPDESSKQIVSKSSKEVTTHGKKKK